MLVDDNDVDHFITQKVIESLNFVERILPLQHLANRWQQGKDSRKDRINFNFDTS